jgi:hypothetical protein
MHVGKLRHPLRAERIGVIQVCELLRRECLGWTIHHMTGVVHHDVQRVVLADDLRHGRGTEDCDAMSSSIVRMFLALWATWELIRASHGQLGVRIAGADLSCPSRSGPCELCRRGSNALIAIGINIELAIKITTRRWASRSN